MRLYRQKCVGMRVQLFKWGGSALEVRSFAYVKCLGVRSLAYLKCAGSAFISIPGVRSFAYEKCIKLHSFISHLFAPGWYQYKPYYETEKNIMHSLNNFKDQWITKKKNPVNYKYHIIWLCPRITSFATLSRFLHISRCSHQMDTFSALLAICVGNLPVTGEFPMQRPVTRNFDVFFDLCLSKQWWGWWFEMPLHPLWHHCDVQTNRWPDWP